MTGGMFDDGTSSADHDDGRPSFFFSIYNDDNITSKVFPRRPTARRRLLRPDSCSNKMRYIDRCMPYVRWRAGRVGLFGACGQILLHRSLFVCQLGMQRSFSLHRSFRFLINVALLFLLRLQKKKQGWTAASTRLQGRTTWRSPVLPGGLLFVRPS